MSYEAYKVLHLVGILSLFASVGGLTALRLAATTERPAGKRFFGILQGIALVVVLAAGFGTLARLGMPSPAGWPAWVWIKVGVWLLVGGSLVALRRAGRWAGLVLLGLILLGGVAAWSAITKP